MKILKIIGLFCLFCITFFYTEKVINVTLDQDELMIRIKEYAKNNNINPINATINDDAIIPGTIGKYIDEEASYKAMKKIGYFEPSLIVYKSIYPEVSIYNNYNKYITSGNKQNKKIALIYILNNLNTIDNILNITNKYNTPINLFIDSNLLSNNINIIDKINNNSIYNYGNNGTYTKDNLIITNNIINNKAHNNSIFCLFLNKNKTSLNNCANNKMLSIYIDRYSNYYNIKNSLENGRLFLIDNTQDLSSIIEYINSKGYNIVSINELINEEQIIN